MVLAVNRNIFYIFIMFNILWAVPRYALESGTSCNLCHIKPNGGGFRNDYGIIYGLDDLPAKTPKQFSSYTGLILNHIQFGGDVRIQSVSRNKGDVPSDLAVFPMQANIQMVYQSAGISVQSEWALLRKDLGFQLSTRFKDNYIQAGKGKPAFGLNLADHTVFTRGGNMQLVHGSHREGMPFSPMLNHAPFIAAGRYVGNGHITVGWSQGYFSSDSESFFTRGEHFGTLGLLNRMIGLSYLQETREPNGLEMMNIFGGLSRGRIAWLGEVTVADGLVQGRSIASYSELTWRAREGWNVSGRVDFFDESTFYTKDAIRRTTFGLNYVPFPFVDIKFQIRSSQLSSGKTSLGLEYLSQLHVWF